MKRLHAHNWQIFTIKKEITSIKKTIQKANIVQWSVAFEVLLLLMAFSLDRIITDSGVDWLWFVLSTMGTLGIAVYIGRQLFVEHRKKKLDSQYRSSKDIVDTFDNEVCYYVMSAESYFELYKREHECAVDEVKQGVQIFYFDETSYYLNKAVSELASFTSNIENAVTMNNDRKDRISLGRLKNIIALLAVLYDELSMTFDGSTTTDGSIAAQTIGENVSSISDLLSFVTSAKTAIKKTNSGKEIELLSDANRAKLDTIVKNAEDAQSKLVS